MKITIDWVICNNESERFENEGALKFTFEIKIRQAVMAYKLGHAKVIESESYFGHVTP